MKWSKARMSALSPIADMHPQIIDVRFVPIAVIQMLGPKKNPGTLPRGPMSALAADQLNL